MKFVSFLIVLDLLLDFGRWTWPLLLAAIVFFNRDVAGLYPAVAIFLLAKIAARLNRTDELLERVHGSRDEDKKNKFAALKGDLNAKKARTL